MLNKLLSTHTHILHFPISPPPFSDLFVLKRVLFLEMALNLGYHLLNLTSISEICKIFRLLNTYLNKP